MVNVQYNPYSTDKKRNPLKWIFLGFLVIIVFSLFALLYHPKNQVVYQSNNNSDNVTGSRNDFQVSDKISSVAKSLLEKTRNESDDEKYFMILEATKTKAKTEQDAILLCSLNNDPKNRNYCLQEMAEEQLNSDYCEIIADPKQKDDCYMLLILQGEDQYCNKLVLRESKDFCDKLLNS